MKTLIIIRHAKSDQSFWGNDFERPLNERGKHDAPVMAQRLLQQLKPDALVASPAARAKNTAEFFAGTFKIPEKEIIFISALYHAPSNVFYEVVKGLPDDNSSVALFSHNPGITHFVNSLNSGAQIDNMPTCGMFAVTADTNTWTDFDTVKKTVLFFDYPKNDH